MPPMHKMVTYGGMPRGMFFNSHLRKHPNEKPESLMCKLVKLYSVGRRNDL